MSWEMTIIGDHCTVTSSKRFHLSERSNSGVPFYCSKEIIQKNRGEEITDCDYISEELYLNIAEKFGVPQENDLLVTTRGTIGVPYLYRRNDRFYFADGNLTWIKDFKETLLPQFLYYWFRTHEGQKKIDAIAKGTAQKAVPIAGIKTLEISLPPVDVQRQIAYILTTYDSLIENNQKQIKLLEEAAQRLYKEWFVDLRFPGHETTPIVDGIPQGWERMVLSEVTSVLKRGISPKYSDNGKYSVINQKCIRSSIMDISESRRQEKEYVPTLNLQDSDTVICSIGTGTLGRVGRVYGDYVREGFSSDEELSLYDMLFSENLSKQDIRKIKAVAVELLQKVKSKIAELDHWTDKQETRSIVYNLIRDDLWSELPACYDEPSISVYLQRIYEYVYKRYKEVA